MRGVEGKISIIMPAYNEAGIIVGSIEETIKTFKAFGCSFELIVMDDGSTDNTYALASNYSSKHPECVVIKRSPFHMGKGRALKKALHYVSGDYVVFLDADMDLHPEQVQTLFDIMHLAAADVVIGSKFHPHSVVVYPWHRSVVSYVYWQLVRLMFGLPCRDTQTGLKIFKAKVLRDVFPRLLVKQFAFDVELLANARHLGYTIADAPIVIRPQKRFGWIRPSAVYTTLVDTLAIFYRLYILKYYDRIDYHRRKNMAKEFRRVHR
jgi:glycosyltransferase involved in cell wall biosynthesis